VPKTYYFVSEYTDEILPCVPTLEGWAAWLAEDVTDSWGRTGPIADGTEFAVSRLTDLGTIDLSKDADGKWQPMLNAVPEGTNLFFAREHMADTGWDADFSGDTIENALTDWPEDEAFLACVREEPDALYRFEAAGPRLVLVGGVN